MIEFLKEVFFFLFRFYQKKKAEAIVLNAEVISHYTGIYSVEIIKEVYEKQGRKNEYLKRVIDKYNQSKSKYEIYDGLFDEEFLKIVRMAEEKHIPISGVFRDYQEVKNKIDKAKKNIFSAVFRPVVVYVIAAAIVYWALGRFLESIGNVRGVELSEIRTIYKFYWPIMMSIPVFILTALFKFPRKVPFLSSAYKELDAFQLLSLCKMFLSMGISTVEIVKVFEKVMGIKTKGKSKVSKKTKQDVSGIEVLSEMLSRYLSSEEAVVFQIAGQTYEYERIISSLVEKRSVEFEARVNAITSVLGEVLIIIAMIPVGVLLLTIMGVLSGVASTLRF